MNVARLRLLRFLSLLFLLPGLAGLIASAAVSIQYEESMPKTPVPSEMRVVPRNIHGSIVYQTRAEDRKLSLFEGASVTMFLIGLTLGGVYFCKWGLARAIGAEDDELATER